MRGTPLPSRIIELDGVWDFSLGNDGPVSSISVPGCWEAQGFSKHVDGPAVYRKVLPTMQDRGDARVILELDAVSYACAVSVNGRVMGSHEGMWTPFFVDITEALAANTASTLQIEVWKPGSRYPVRESLAGFLPDVATTFGGLWQSCRLRIGRQFLRGVDLSADMSRSEISFRATAEDFGGTSTGRIEILVRDGGAVVARSEGVRDEDGTVLAVETVPEAQEWSPSSPHLYEVSATWIDGKDILAAWSGKTGFRQLLALGDRLLLNGRPAFLRGVLSWGWDPMLLAPRFDRQSIRREFALLKSLGFNMVKLCLFIPSQELFEVADEEGMLLWEELPLWLPEVTPALAERAPEEYRQYARRVASHPSVALYTLGCEMGASVTPALLSALDGAVRPYARGALVCDNSGSGESYGGRDADVADFTDYHPYYDMHWFEPLMDNWRRDWKPPRPWIFGEFCDQDAFRDREAMKVRNGGVLPWWMTPDLPVAAWRGEAQALLEADERLARAALPVPASLVAAASDAHALVTRKYTLESLRKKAGMGGYVVTGLRDTPISTSGILDDEGRARWSAEQLRACNDEVILCLDVPRRRAWTHGGDRPSRIDMHCWWAGEKASWTVIVSTYAPVIPAGAAVTWHLERADGISLAHGQTRTDRELYAGTTSALAAVEVSLPEVVRAEKAVLSVRMTGGSLRVDNAWPIWIFPRPASMEATTALYDPSFQLEGVTEGISLGARITDPALTPTDGVLIAASWDEKVAAHFVNGGRILFWQLNAGPFPSARGPFWREAVPLFMPHRLWEGFPHGDSTDMQFFGMATDVMLDAGATGTTLGPEARIHPLLRRLDARTFLMHEYLMEAHSGSGRMILSTLRFHGGAGAQPSGFLRNVAGHALFAQLVADLRLP